ncbi:MAG: YkgJ family cysteine cluster protein [Dehalogenimonas sp.]|uniref:YkgJ family cysteine cluster protein n=1 Tax=Candidatus Dehalogenimonas loeffleri TaxID=3127115 RepID=A0ABZ2J6F5_9CHLR|nr:YkgJ family cysteine cluster protein [Dehalogenimonas sp.]
MKDPKEFTPEKPDLLSAVRNIVARETDHSASPIPESVGRAEEPHDGLTRSQLEQHWDQEAAQFGVERIMGVPSLRFNWRTAGVAQKRLMTFLPFYLVSRFLKCQGCSQCCRPNFLYWDKGIVLSRDEALRLKHLCKLEKRNGKTIMKYPCPLLNGKRCSHYKLRPAGCRFFPFNKWQDEATGEEGLGILMHCPAAKEFYVTVNLFMLRLHRFMQDRAEAGGDGFNFEELDGLSADFSPNKISPEDLRYMVLKAEAVR